LKNAAWLGHQQVDGLQWKVLTECVKAADSVKVCAFMPESCSQPEAAALARLTTLIESSPSCASFSGKYCVQEATLCRSKPREIGLLATALNLEIQYSTNPSNYDLSHLLGPADSMDGLWRKEVLDYFKRYPTLADEAYKTRICLGFHTAPSKDVANSILQGNFAKLSKLDAGFIGSGVYLTFDLDYAFEEYGVNTFGLEEVPVVVCAVVVGNPFPVIECPECKPTKRKCCSARPVGESYLGCPIVARAGAHIAVMGKDFEHHDSSNPLPAHPSRWGEIDAVTEICVNEDKVLPLGVLLVKRKGS